MIVLQALLTVLVLVFVFAVLPLGLGKLLVGGQETKLALLGGLFAEFCLFEVLAMISHVTMGSLRLMTGLWSVACVALAMWGYLRAKRRAVPRPVTAAVRWDRVEKLLLAAVIAMVVLQTLNTVLNTYYGNWDDETYCGTAVTSWYTDTVNRYAPSTGALQRPFYNDKYVIASWPVFSSMLAILTGVHPAILFRTILPLLEIPFAYWIAYQLLRLFFPNSRKKALLGTLYYTIFVLMAAESMNGTSGEWWLVVNCWTGKALTASIMTPLILWLLIRLEEAADPAQRRTLWRVLLFVCWSCCFVSASLFFVVPLELALWGGFCLLRNKRWPDVLRYLVCGLPTAFCALITLF